MNPDKVITVAVLLVTTIFLVKEWLPQSLLALLAPLTLVLAGVIEPQTMWNGLAQEAVVAIGGMFVVSAGLSKTGALGFLGEVFARLAARGRRRIVITMMLGVAVLSALVNNTTVVLVFLPVVLAMCERIDHPPSRYLIPLSFASIFGGMMTLIGTTTNVVVAGAGRDAVAALGTGVTFEPGMWTFTPVGLIFTVAGALYMATIGIKLLPDRVALSMTLGAGKVTEYVTEAEITENSPFVGKTLGEVVEATGLRVLQLIRNDVIEVPSPERAMQAGDVLLVKGAPGQLLELHGSDRSEVEVGLQEDEQEESEEAPLKTRGVNMTLAEVIVPPGSRWVGRQVQAIGFRARYGVSVIALQRHGHHIRQKVGEIIVEPADMLLVQGTVDSLRRLRASEHMILVEGVQNDVKLRKMAPRALGVLGLFVFLVATQMTDVATASLCAACSMVLSRCITITEAFSSMDWNVVFLLVGFLVLGQTMDQVGVSADIATFVCGNLEGAPVWLTVAILYALVAFMSDILSNQAAAALMVPVVVNASVLLGIHPETLLMTVAFAASAAFLTPVGYQTNLLVYAPGGYRFADYIRVGFPLRILFIIIAAIFIPMMHRG